MLGTCYCRHVRLHLDSEVLLNVMAQWLRKLGRFREAMAVSEELVRRFPNNEGGYFDLAVSKIYAGFPEEAIPLEEKAIRLNPHSAYLFNHYRYLGFASLMLGRDGDATSFLERSLAMNPDDNGYRQWTYRFLAAAYARAGHMAEAKRAVAEGDRLWPYDTVRIHFPEDPSSTAYVEQVRRFQDGLRLAGERDHADEDADFGVPADANLHSEFAGLTPTHAPGHDDDPHYKSCAVPRRRAAGHCRHGILFMGAVDPWRRWAGIWRSGWQLYGRGAGPPTQQNATTDYR